MTALASTSPSAGGGKTEIRIALVLYGGVSLAVYENGVTRAFHDLVMASRAREDGRPVAGALGILLELRDASAVVDVIAGTSAGGINGLMLAAALESGQDFAQTADLWREHGDLGALLRPASAADRAESLLDGEGYYQRKLFEAFQDLVTRVPGHVLKQEMDVFITGTDLDGRIHRYRDALGADIQDKTHRVVFHLKHRDRPGLAGLLGVVARGDVDHAGELQAATLASIARITSTFPVAFPPFRACQLDELGLDRGTQDRVVSALDDLGRDQVGSKVADGSDPWYVDGGVLDNKPFGPVLDAIFYRMPDGSAVERRLFYVEPDPVSYAAERPKRNAWSPAAVGLAALTTLPSHESIVVDLESLRSHNARVRWLKAMQARVDMLRASGGGAEVSEVERGVYALARVESLAKSLVLEWDGVPAAGDSPRTAARMALYDDLLLELKLRTGLSSDLADPGQTAGLDHFDVQFHLRRAFHFLYRLDERSQADRPPAAVLAIGRIIRALEIVRWGLIGLRDEILRSAEGTRLSADDVLDAFKELLCEDDPSWVELAGVRDATIDLLADRETGSLASDRLTRVRDAVAVRSAEVLARPRPAQSHPPSARTILDVLGEALERVVSGAFPGPAPFADFAIADIRAFPIEYTTGIHERDEVEFIRVSPEDAKQGLSIGLGADDKVTGEGLGHFAAFLRRDWRSNDIAWGRIDGTCRIIEALATDDKIADMARRLDDVPQVLELAALGESLPNASASQRMEVAEAGRALFAPASRSLFDARPLSDGARALCARFRRALIIAGQVEAVANEVATVLADMEYQDITWDQMSPPATDTRRAREEGMAAEDDVRALRRREETLLKAARERTREVLRKDAPLEGIHGRLREVRTELRRGRDGRAERGPALAAAQRAHGVRASTGAPLRQLAGDEWARSQVARLTPWERAERFVKLRIGTEKAFGPQGRVPENVAGEYVSQAYLLLWSMMDRSLGTLKKDSGASTTPGCNFKPPHSLLGSARLKLFFFWPVRAIQAVLGLMRRDATFATFLLVAVGSALACGGLLSWCFGRPWWATLFVVGLLVEAAIIAFFVPPSLSWRRRKRRLLLAAAVVLLLVAVAAVVATRSAAMSERALPAARGSGAAGALTPPDQP